MSPRSATESLIAPDQTAALGLREALARAGYQLDQIKALLHIEADLSSSTTDLPVYLRRAAGDSPLATLVQLFLLSQPVPELALQRALAPIRPSQLEDLGLVRLENGTATGLIRLVPHGELLIACDRNPEYGGEADPEHVTGINSPAVLLAGLTVRRPVATALDLGTGNGIQAVLAARHAERVTAVDINPRAIAYARFNAALSGRTNVDCQVGDLFEPVRGRRFDLITCNPPYVISPDSDFIYRDSGEPSDSLCRRITRLLPEYLEEGGFGQMLISWVRPPQAAWQEGVRGWFEGRGCDAWLLHYRTEDPLTHAAKWLRPLSLGNLGGYPAAIDRWLDYYRHEGIEAIAFGALTLRRRAGGSNWSGFEELHAVEGSASGQILRAFAAQDFLSEHPDDKALLALRLRLTPEARLSQTVAPSEEGWELVETTLTTAAGIAFSGSLDVPMATLVRDLDGTRPLRDAIGEHAKGRRSEAIGLARRLLELGFFELGRA